MADEHKIYPMPSIAEAAFPQLREVMKAEETFPHSFGAWQALWETRRKQEEGNGFNVQLIEVKPQGFANFCKTRNKPANWLSMVEYITAKAGL